MLLDMPSLAAMKILLREFIERATGGIHAWREMGRRQTWRMVRRRARHSRLRIALDRDRRVVGWNAWLASASGIRAEAALGRTLEELFEDRLLRRLSSAIGEALDSGASSLLTHSLHPKLFPLKTRTDQQLVHDVFVRPVGAKPYSGCIVQITDVTLSAQRERVLRQRLNARYAAVVDSAQDAILTIDADGIIQLANPAAAREFGIPAADLSPDWRSAICSKIARRGNSSGRVC